MNKATILGIIVSIFLVTMISVISAYAAPIPVRIDEVRVDDYVLSPTDVNRLDIIRGQEVPVDIKLTGLQNTQNVEVAAFISGFEYSDVEPISDATRVFDADANVSYIKRLSVRVSDNADEDDYKLRIIISNRNDQEIIQTYSLKIDVPRHSLRVEDIVLTPNDNIQAGKALLGKVRLENKGEKQENDIKVTISIPELGVSSSDYIDEIRANREEETEEIFLKIPETAKTGRYEAHIDVEFQQRHNKLSATRGINVIGKEGSSTAHSNSETNNRNVQPKPRAVIAVTSQLESSNGGAAIFPISITNNYDESKVATITIIGNRWADVSMTPSSTQVVDSGETKLFTVSIKPRDDAPTGAHVIQATVRVGDEISKQVPLTVNVMEQRANSVEIIKQVLEGVLIVLVIILVIVGLVVAFNRKGFQPNESGTQPYY